MTGMMMHMDHCGPLRTKCTVGAVLPAGDIYGSIWAHHSITVWVGSFERNNCLPVAAVLPARAHHWQNLLAALLGGCIWAHHSITVWVGSFERNNCLPVAAVLPARAHHWQYLLASVGASPHHCAGEHGD